MEGPHEKVDCLHEGGRDDSEEIMLIVTSVLDFWPPETWGINSCWLHSVVCGASVVAA